MLIPTGHESLEGRRWPYVTIAIIVLNAIAFAATFNSIDRESEELWLTKLRILMLEAAHPYLEKTPDVQEMIDKFKAGQPKLWARIDDPNRPPEDMWDIEMREYESWKAQAELDTLTEQYNTQRANSVLEKYAFFSHKKDWYRYITASFLHGGWFHIIFNMWFLWLAGTVIEDAWGRAIYTAFYALGGLAAMLAHTAGNPGSVIPAIGASGAVAALMGAFLVRFTTTKINFVLMLWFGFRPYFWRFKAPAYVMLPLWLATQLFWVMMLSGIESGGGVAYWAHIGGFAFGVAGALLMKFSGLEHKVSKSIDAEVGWSADERLVKAGELMALRTDEAITELSALLAEKPADVDALKLLVAAHWKKQDMPAHNAALAQLFSAQVKAKHFDAALESLDEAVQHGLFDSSASSPATLAPADFMALCRWLESQQNFERAAAEYERYAQLFPKDRMSVYALVAAARLQMKQLNNRSEAARLYRAAQASPVPHLDWDDAIARGLREAEAQPVHA